MCTSTHLLLREMHFLGCILYVPVDWTYRCQVSYRDITIRTCFACWHTVRVQVYVDVAAYNNFIGQHLDGQSQTKNVTPPAAPPTTLPHSPPPTPLEGVRMSMPWVNMCDIIYHVMSRILRLIRPSLSSSPINMTEPKWKLF